MKKKVIILSVAVAAVLLAIYFLQGPGAVPAGQRPLTTLTAPNAGAFESRFDGDANAPCVVLLLSPT
jgi:hypothetical protein